MEYSKKQKATLDLLKNKKVKCLLVYGAARSGKTEIITKYVKARKGKVLLVNSNCYYPKFSKNKNKYFYEDKTDFYDCIYVQSADRLKFEDFLTYRQKCNKLILEMNPTHQESWQYKYFILAEFDSNIRFFKENIMASQEWIERLEEMRFDYKERFLKGNWIELIREH